MIAAYTKSPGHVKIQSIEPANSCRLVIQLPEKAAQVLLQGVDAHDPELRMFLDDIKLLSVHLLRESSATAMRTRESNAIQQPALNLTDLTFLTNAQGQTLREPFFAVLLHNDTRFFDCLVGYFYISGFHKLYPSLENVEKSPHISWLANRPRRLRSARV